MVVTRTLQLAVGMILSLSAMGCHSSTEEIQTQAEPQPDPLPEAHRPFVHMADNAAMYDLSIADVHFVPHTTELNGLGVKRLDRLALLLKTYGGTIRYQTALKDSTMVETRLAHVREYLQTTGLDVTDIHVTTGLPGGRGGRATEAAESLNEMLHPPATGTTSVGPSAESFSTGGQSQ